MGDNNAEFSSVAYGWIDLQGLMCDKNFCTLYSLFMLALARKELSTCSFRLFIGEKPILLQTIEDLSTKATEEELKEAFVDEWGVKYSKDGRKLLKAPYELDGTYSIRKGIKIICDEAFADCKFIGCRSLTSLVIPDSVTNIGDYAFWNCRSLTDIVIPDGVTSIGKCAFEGCSALSSVVIPDSVSCIGFGAFNIWMPAELSIPKEGMMVSPLFAWTNSSPLYDKTPLNEVEPVDVLLLYG